MDLEQTVIEYEKAGQEWIEAKLKADQLEEGQKNYLAALINALDQGIYGERTVSESKLEREARGSEEYQAYTRNLCLARAEMLRKKVRFDALDKLFEARRSQQSFEKE